MKIKNFIFTAILLIMIGGFYSCTGRDPEVQDSKISDLSFTPCKQTQEKRNSPSDGVNVEFTNQGVQITYNNFEVACDFSTIDVTYTFVNGFLNITQQGLPNQADCICYSDVSYTIESILQSEVNVIFINGVQVYCHNDTTEIPFTENSVWKYTDEFGVVIMLTFYQSENKLHIQSTPEILEFPYLFWGDVIMEYIMVGDIMYLPDHNGNLDPNGQFATQFSWTITYPSENEMTMTYRGTLPSIPYIRIYHFIRQTN